MTRTIRIAALLALLGVVPRAWALSGGTHINVTNGTVAFTGLVTSAEGGTGANNTATTGRYLRGDGTNFVTSTVAAAGAGTCTNQFVRATVDNATPTCATVSLTADVSGTLPTGNGGTGLAAANDDEVMVGNGTVWQSKALTNCTGAGKAVTYATASNTFGCNTISGATPVVFFGSGMDLTTTQTVFVGLGGGVDGTEGVVQAASPAATYMNLRCVNSAIQGVGNAVTITSRVGACGSQADGTLLVSITGSAAANQAAADTTNNIAPTAGQCVDFKIVTPAALTANARIGCSVERTA